MVIKSTRFDPEVMLSAPRRSAGIPSPNGAKVLFTTDTYSFKHHRKDSELRVLDVFTGESKQLALNADISEAVWLGDSQCLCLKARHHGVTEFCVCNVDHPETRWSSAGTMDASAANLKVVPLNCDQYVVVVSARASPDGKPFNAEKAKKTHSTGKLYTKLFVRHWDEYEEREKNSLFFCKMSRDCHGKWKLGTCQNALLNLGLECPIQPFGGVDNYDACNHGMVFVAKDPTLDPAMNTKTNVYFLSMGKWDESGDRLAQRVVIPGFEGASTCPVFSPDGSYAAFLSMRTQGYEADKNQIFVIPCPIPGEPQGELVAKRAFASNGGNIGSWDRSPSSIAFTADTKHLIAIADDYGRNRVFMLKADLTQEAPYALTCKGSISDARPMADGNIFISGSSLTDNSFFAVVVPVVASAAPSEAQFDAMMPWINSNSGHGNKFGLSSRQVSWIQTPASNPSINETVHSLVVRPSSHGCCDQNKTTYPVAYVIHGGPQSAWQDSWSTRWNLAILAEQGYVVICPNITGSTGYGQAFTDAIKSNWGGDPYQDFVNVFEWVGKNLPEADNSRAVALGASYGGYMMNWIQGHDLGRRMKCIVCHDGITSFAGSALATDELYFFLRDLGGVPWMKPNPARLDVAAQVDATFSHSSLPAWRRYDPSEHFEEWATPQLVIHSEKDYRLPIAEGLAAFNVLQARDVDSQFLTFPDENHWVLKPENSLVWHKVVLNWINKYVGLPAYSKEDPEDEGQKFFGGEREDWEEVADMMTQGNPAI